MSSTAPQMMLFLALLAAPALAGQTKEEIARFVQQLGDADFATRQKASELLWKAGRAAEPALTEAVKSDDAEVARRSREILDRFRWGIYPDTPKNIVDLVTRYQAADRPGKQTIIRELLDLGGPGCAALLKVAGAEEDRPLVDLLLQQVTQEAPRAFPLMLAERNFQALQDLLDLSLQHDVDSSMQNYVAYYLLRGQLDERIAHFKTQVGKKGGPPAEEVLAWLYRAKGDVASARQMAERSGKKDLLDWLLYEQGNWKELAQRDPGVIGEPSTELEKLSFQAGFQRLAGNQKGFEKAIAGIKLFASEKAKEETGELWLCAKALILNGRVDDGLALLREGRRNLTTAFEVLCAQLRYGEAFELVARAQKAGGKPEPFLLILQARALLQLGEKDNAQQIFAKLAGQFQDKQDKNDLPWIGELIETEFRAGLRDQALAHCALALPAAEDETAAVRLLARVYPEQGDAAEVWWRFLRKKFVDETPPLVMKRLGALLSGRLTTQELTAWTQEPKQQKEMPAEQLERWHRACAAAWRAAGNERQERAFLEMAAAGGSANALVQWSDFLAARNEWQAAAELYGKAWTKDRRDPLPLYLQGNALLRSGKKEEGERLVLLAHQLPLGDEEVRVTFLEALNERGFKDAARRELDLLRRIHAPGSLGGAAALRYQANEALAQKDYLLAADYDERAMLRVLRSYVSFIAPTAYVRVPEYIHRYRARGYTTAGRFDDARREIELALALLPSDIELPILLVGELEKKGQAKEAAALFARLYALYEKLCKDYPHSAWGHNSLAWLAACCRRQLDAGLAHARKAVELEPDNSGYRDTLAEIYFQRGEQEQAIAAMKKCIEMDPKRAYYRKQLERFEKGDRMAELPAEGDE